MMMKQLLLNAAITAFTVKADSFPEGVRAAHQQLHGSVKRKYFGISRPEGTGGISYYAAAAELEPGELSKHGLPVFEIIPGHYIYTDIPDFMNNIPAIGQAFQQLLAQTTIDPNGACIEWYLENAVCRCMVRIIS
jgi:hypothetical protein